MLKVEDRGQPNAAETSASVAGWPRRAKNSSRSSTLAACLTIMREPSGGAGEAQDALGADQMRSVDHLAVDPDDAQRAILLEGGHHLPRPFDLLRLRREGLVHRIDMLGMDD